MSKKRSVTSRQWRPPVVHEQRSQGGQQLSGAALGGRGQLPHRTKD